MWPHTQQSTSELAQFWFKLVKVCCCFNWKGLQSKILIAALTGELFFLLEIDDLDKMNDSAEEVDVPDLLGDASFVVFDYIYRKGMQQEKEKVIWQKCTIRNEQQTNATECLKTGPDYIFSQCEI